MNDLNEFLKSNGIKPLRYTKKGKVIIVETKDNKYIIKKRIENKELYDYLKSRNFNYFPNSLSNDTYEVINYIEEINTPKEQKLTDMIKIVALLHAKTSFIKTVDIDEYKKIYEDLNNNISYLYSYYMDKISIIESKIYMSPSEYLLVRNISKVFERLDKLKLEIDEWYSIVSESNTMRMTLLHNNLEISHFLKSEENYLISWDKSKVDMPIFDLYKMYVKNDIGSFNDLLEIYEDIYPLLEHEKKLLHILVSMPLLIETRKTEYENTIYIRKVLTKLDNSKHAFKNTRKKKN